MFDGALDGFLSPRVQSLDSLVMPDIPHAGEHFMQCVMIDAVLVCLCACPCPLVSYSFFMFVSVLMSVFVSVVMIICATK